MENAGAITYRERCCRSEKSLEARRASLAVQAHELATSGSATT